MLWPCERAPPRARALLPATRSRSSGPLGALLSSSALDVRLMTALQVLQVFGAPRTPNARAQRALGVPQAPLSGAQRRRTPKTRAQRARRRRRLYGGAQRRCTPKTRAQRALAARSAATGGGQQVREIKRHFRFRGFATNIEIRYKSTLAETADRQTESTQVQTRVAPVAAAHPPELDGPIGRPLPLGSALDASRAAWVGRNRATVTPRPRSRTDGDRGDGVSTLHRRERRP